MSKRARDEEDEDQVQPVVSQPQHIECTIPPCHSEPKLFSSYEEYETHILSFHNHICNECRRRFPSEKFLHLHIDENHNPFVKIEQEKGAKVFKCFNYGDGCSKVCSTPKKRRLHMIDKHGYPRLFRFDVVNRGI